MTIKLKPGQHGEIFIELRVRSQWAAPPVRPPTPDADQVITAPAFGALTAELRRAEADGHDIESVLPQLVAQRGLDDADDPAAVLHHRLATAKARPVRHDGLTIQRRPPRRIAGLIPEAGGSMTDEFRQASKSGQRCSNNASPTSSNAPSTTMSPGSPRSVLNQARPEPDTHGTPLHACSPPAGTVTASRAAHRSEASQSAVTFRPSTPHVLLLRYGEQTSPGPHSPGGTRLPLLPRPK